MNNEQIPPPSLGEPKGSTIRHKSPIKPISPKDTLPHLGGLRGASSPFVGTKGGFCGH